MLKPEIQNNMKYPIITIALTAFVLMSCASSKDLSQDVPKQDPKEMIAKGFVRGEIVYSDVEGDCEYTIHTIDDPVEYLDPFNLSDDFKRDGMKVWVKYTGLRQDNRCEKARPIEINEIEERGE